MSTTNLINRPWECEARAEYVRIATLSAFNLQGVVRTRRNGAASTYVFGDGSKLVVGKAGWHRYHGTDGLPYAERASAVVGGN